VRAFDGLRMRIAGSIQRYSLPLTMTSLAWIGLLSPIGLLPPFPDKQMFCVEAAVVPKGKATSAVQRVPCARFARLRCGFIQPDAEGWRSPRDSKISTANCNSKTEAQHAHTAACQSLRHGSYRKGSRGGSRLVCRSGATSLRQLSRPRAYQPAPVEKKPAR
jgi:hypothetical protein